MEDALAPVMFSAIGLAYNTVLILVVMEDALALDFNRLAVKLAYFCLNPCCNGRCTRTAKLGLCFV